MMYAKKITVVSLVSLMACLAGQAAFSNGAQHVQTPAQVQEFKLIPRVSLWGFTGDYTRGEGQAMIPIVGDSTRAFYFLAEGNKVANDSDWMGGAGLGYRQVIKGQIFGGYLIGNYHNSSENNGFYIANPGLEMLGEVWDINVNGYLPFMQKNSVEAVEGIASEDFGNTTFIRFTGHNEFDHMFRVYGGGKNGKRFGEEAARGFDGEIGRIIPHIEDLRIYIGGYHFDADDADSVNGFEARAVYELNRYFALEGEYNYDNIKHSAAVVGLRFTLGGYSKEESKRYGIATRLLYPIEHDLVTGSSGPVETRIVQKTIDLGETQIHDNIQFFKPLGSSVTHANDVGPLQGDGTFENPYIGFTPANVAGIPETIGPKPIDQHPLLYFAPGEYNFVGFQSQGINERFNLPNGWGMYGRSVDYKTFAFDSDRAHFSGGLDLIYDVGKGSDKTILNSIRVEVTPTAVVGTSNSALQIINAQNAVLQNSEIANILDLGTVAATGILIDSSHLSFEELSKAISGNTFIHVLESRRVTIDREAGINAADSTIIFVGGINTIEASLSNSRANVVAILIDNSFVLFNGGTNVLNALASATFLSPVNASSSGIFISPGAASSSSAIIFSGGKNQINASSIRSSGGSAIAAGINDVGNVTINFAGGSNSISSLARSEGGNIDARGIFIAASAPRVGTLNFSGGVNNITVGAIFSPDPLINLDVFGIDANANANLQINGNPVTNLDDILNFVNIERTASSNPGGFKIQWGALTLNW